MKARTARLPLWRRLGWRLGASFLLLTCLAILISGYLQYREQDRAVRESLGALLLNISRTGALLVDGDLHEVALRAGRNATPEYAKLRDTLKQIQDVNQLRDPIYTLSHVESDRARFAVISTGHVPLGTPYRLAPDIRRALARTIAEGVSSYTDIYVSDNGTWITAFAPVRNAAGQTVAALDVDVRADVYLAQLAAVRRRLYLHSIVGALLALVAGALLARRITRPVGQLAAAARAVVEGDLHAGVRITSRDEIGLLGNVFHLMIERLALSNRSIVAVLGRALEARDGGPGSLRRLADATLALADRFDVSPAQREAIELGALLHDIGEIRTPEAILGKPARLTADEYAIVKRHPTAGTDLLETVPLLTPAVDVVGSHHERWDGAGYPLGLHGDAIPLPARIFAVVDTLDAMTQARPWRAAFTVSEALDAIRDGAGKQFDPRVVEAALTIGEHGWTRLLEAPRDATEAVAVEMTSGA
jgi:HAMP domain-containing protein